MPVNSVNTAFQGVLSNDKSVICLPRQHLPFPNGRIRLQRHDQQKQLQSDFYIASAATSTEEIWNGIGNPVYPPAQRELAKHGISCEGKRAVQLKKSDYDKYHYLIGMEGVNRRNMLRILGSDPEHKVSLLLDYSDRPRDIADPWYTGNFELTYRDIVEGCEGFLEYLRRKGSI